jgi:SynChlorMet cassette radical SAM/SPASM protein ScmF
MVDEKRKSAGDDVPTLDQIYFYLTEGCNLACRHCWLSPKLDRTGNKYPTLQIGHFETAIQEAKPLGLSGVKLTGGEPLLHPHFTELLGIIREADLTLTIETNGLLCTPQIAAEIAKSQNPFVSVSIDGIDPETHESIRGVKGSFEKARQAVRNLSDVGIFPQIIMSLMRCNSHQVDVMVDMAKSLGASSLKFNIVQPTGRGKNIEAQMDGLDIPELIEIGRHIDRELQPGTDLKLFFDYPIAFRPLSRIAGGDGAGTCGILGIIGVIPNGRYAMCGIGEHIPDLIYGKVGKDRLEEVWLNNPKLIELRQGMPVRLDGVCAHCLMKYRCLGSCVAQNYYRNKSLWAPFWFCDQAREIGLFPDTRLNIQYA